MEKLLIFKRYFKTQLYIFPKLNSEQMSYKSYYNVQPCQSKMLQAKWDKRHYDAHLKKLSEMQPQIDTRAPKTYIHMHLKLNKIRLEEERLYIIERDNRLLLEKMSHTMRTRGRIDNVNEYETRSLNRLQRQRELLRVTRENQHFMQRIMHRKPEYNNKQLEKEWKRNLACMHNLTNFPMLKPTKKNETAEEKMKKEDKTNEVENKESPRKPKKDEMKKKSYADKNTNEAHNAGEVQDTSQDPSATDTHYEDDFTEEGDEEVKTTADHDDALPPDTATEEKTTIAEEIPEDKLPIKEVSVSPQKAMKTEESAAVPAKEVAESTEATVTTDRSETDAIATPPREEAVVEGDGVDKGDTIAEDNLQANSAEESGAAVKVEETTTTAAGNEAADSDKGAEKQKENMVGADDGAVKEEEEVEEISLDNEVKEKTHTEKEEVL